MPVLVVGRGSNLLVADSGFDGVALVLGRRLRAIWTSTGRPRACVGGRRGRAPGARAPGRGGRARRPRVLRRHPGFGRRRGAHERRRPRPRHRGRARAVPASVRSPTARSGTVPSPTSTSATGVRRSGPAPSCCRRPSRATPTTQRRAAARIDEIVRWRREHQPGGQNAGSVFTNPPGDAAGRLIEACGCKGLRIGGAVGLGEARELLRRRTGRGGGRRLRARARRCSGASPRPPASGLEPELHSSASTSEVDTMTDDDRPADPRSGASRCEREAGHAASADHIARRAVAFIVVGVACLDGRSRVPRRRPSCASKAPRSLDADAVRRRGRTSSAVRAAAARRHRRGARAASKHCRGSTQRRRRRAAARHAARSPCTSASPSRTSARDDTHVRVLDGERLVDRRRRGTAAGLVEIAVRGTCPPVGGGSHRPDARGCRARAAARSPRRACRLRSTSAATGVTSCCTARGRCGCARSTLEAKAAAALAVLERLGDDAVHLHRRVRPAVAGCR